MSRSKRKQQQQQLISGTRGCDLSCDRIVFAAPATRSEARPRPESQANCCYTSVGAFFERPVTRLSRKRAGHPAENTIVLRKKERKDAKLL